jgi:hypothetical protein
MQSECRIELLPGSYNPRFVWDRGSLNDPAAASQVQSPNVPSGSRELPRAEQHPAIPPLNIVGIMRPALIALFICALFLRQQIQSGDPWQQFWDTRLQGKTFMILTGEKAPDQPAMSNGVVQAIAPLIWLAGRYNLKPLMSSNKAGNDDKQAGLGGDAVIIHTSEATPPEFAADKRLRYLISAAPESQQTGPSQPDSLRLIDRLALSQDAFATDHTAVLTVFPDHPAVLWIAGTDWSSINKLAEMITSRGSFPSQLNAETEAGCIVQAVLRGGSSSHPELYTHQP